MQKVHYNYNVLLGGVILAIALAIGALSASLNAANMTGRLKAIILMGEGLKSAPTQMTLQQRSEQARLGRAQMKRLTILQATAQRKLSTARQGRNPRTGDSAQDILLNVRGGLRGLQTQVENLIDLAEGKAGTTAAKKKMTTRRR